jgi:hypothetical protein
MILWIIISAMTLFLLWFLFAPLIIKVNSDNQRYSLSLPGIFKVLVVPDNQLFHIRLWVLFIPFNIKPFGRAVKKSEGKQKKKKRSRDLSKLMKARFIAIRELTRSFKLKKMWLNIDTDDFILNAQLVPVFSTMNNQHVNLTVNFEGDISLFMILKNRIASLLWIGIKYLYRTKY